MSYVGLVCILSQCCLNSALLLVSESGGLDDIEVMPDQIIGLITKLLDRNRTTNREGTHPLLCVRS